MPNNNQPLRRDLNVPITSRPISVKPVEEGIRKGVESTVKRRLGLSGALPADLKDVISAAAKNAAAQSVELSVVKAAEEAARDAARPNVTVRFDEKVSIAAESLAHIGASSKVDRVLKSRSQLLAKKRDSLVAAGFSNEEAMQILLADIAARSH